MSKTSDAAWVCNECGAHEYTMSVSYEDACHMGCGSCGGVEFHKESPPAAPQPAAPCAGSVEAAWVEKAMELHFDASRATVAAIREFIARKSTPEYHRRKALADKAEEALRAHLSSAPVPAVKGLRMLEWHEIAACKNEDHSINAQALQRVFCSVNGLGLPHPAEGGAG